MQNITSGSALWRKSSLSLFCSVFFAAGSHSANAASYYVNDNNTAGDIYTTAVGSNLNSGTMASPYLSIQSAIDAASSGDTIYVDAGTYNENVSVDKSLTLLGAGSGATIIDGDNNGSGLGTIFLPTGGNNIQIGAMSQGFHIIGIDGLPGIEKAAIYLDGTQTNITIIDNEIEARGDAGLMGEYNAANNNIVIDHNHITGQTFNGTNPAGVGSGAQFTLPNVPRQAVVFGGGSGTSNTMNFTFTNNVISTVTGGQSTTDNSGNPISPTDQGNMLVTLDLVGTNTISGNTFNGTTVSWYAALRTRGTGYTIDNNIFNGNYLVGMATGSNAVDASLNYWGDASGPNNPVNNACGAGKYVPNNVTLAPFYTDASLTTTSNGAPSVSNITQNTSFCSIQAAVDAANATDTIVASAGTYDEVLLIDKALTLFGPNDNISAVNGTRVSEAILLQRVNISATTDVTISGFEFFEVPATSTWTIYIYGNSNNFTFENNRFIDNDKDAIRSGISSATGNVTVKGNLIDGLTNTLSSGIFLGGIYGTSLIADNKIDLAYNGTPTGYSGIQTPSADGLTISGNEISNTTNQGLQLAGTCGNVTIENNSISNTNTANGSDKGAIRLYGTAFTGPITIQNNNLTNSYNGVAVKNGEDLTGQNITITNNNLTGNSNKAIYNGASTGGVNAPCNWYGTTDDAAIQALLVGLVNYTPFLNNGTDNDVAQGFQPVPGACSVDLTGLYVNDNNTAGDIFTSSIGNDANSGTSSAPYLTIQAAVNAADAGDTIYVDAGAYTEQVEITKDVEIIGAGIGVTTILGSANMPLFFTTSGDNYPIVYVHDADNVNIKDLTVDGDGKGNSNYRYQGVGYSNAGGTLDNIEITSVIETPFNGNQHGIGLFADASSGTARTLTLKNSMIRDCQKNAISLSGADLTGYVNDNMITGAGAIGTPLPAQNGIQFYGTAGGEIKNNIVKGFWYTPTNWTATGMLLYSNLDTVIVDGNDLDSNDAHIYAFDCDAVVTNNDMKDGNYGVISYGNSTTAKANISNNFISNVETGIGVYGTAEVDANENSIVNITTFAIENGASAMDANCNWYGTSHDASIQALLDGSVNYTPFLNNGTDNDIAVGFQPVPGSCVTPPQSDSLLIVSNGSWMMSTEVNTVDASSYPWQGVSSLPDVSTYTLPAVVGQPYHYHSIDSVEGARVLRADNGIRFFRTTFNLNVDTGVAAQIISRMDDGMEIYINGHMIAREANRTTANFLGLPHNLVLLQNGDQDNGHNGELEFDVVNNYRLDSVVVTGENELIIALRNAPQTSDKGGFSFRMELKTGEVYMPALTGYLVSDVEWMQSTVTTPGGTSFDWAGVSGLPAASTFTKNAMLGQPYGHYGIEEVPGSFAIKAGADVTYFTRRFTIMDSADVNVRLRSTFDENVMIYVNAVLIAADYSTNINDRALAAHDVDFQAGGAITNGNAGGDMFDQVESVNFDNILRKGDNYVTVALRNKGNTDKGGFSLRLDMDKAGNPVIRKTTSERNGNEDKKANDLQVNFNIYPNPTTGRVIIDLIESPSGDNTITVLDLNGKVIMDRSLVNPQTGMMDIDLSELANGMYIIRVKSGGENYQSKRVMKF
ncbi:right-handed parallel beta-helix repeat-containing protein [Owenweeksia hongkongensis]|uniref:right-handed parallel beta-helix repeat-containing protein n=1 Tax=Owenweeksia hongkongensis TaxID=253245 RepID=UPI003A92DC3C